MIELLIPRLAFRCASLTVAVAIATVAPVSACPNMAVAAATCKPDHPARILEHAVPPGSWDRPQLGMKPVYVKLDVEVAADGRVVTTRVLQSSGWKSIDATTVKAARDSKYEPAVKRCTPYSSHVVFVQRYPVAH